MRRKAKFLLFFFLGSCIFILPFIFTMMVQVSRSLLSLYGILFSSSFLGGFFIYCFFIYRSIYKGLEPKYPVMPPEGRMDIYFPRTDIPRPIHEDVRRYPEFFKKKKKKKYKRIRQVKKKT